MLAKDINAACSENDKKLINKLPRKDSDTFNFKAGDTCSKLCVSVAENQFLIIPRPPVLTLLFFPCAAFTSLFSVPPDRIPKRKREVTVTQSAFRSQPLPTINFHCRQHE
jgi:hypothetical protein